MLTPEKIIKWLDDNNVIAINKDKSLDELGWLITMEKRRELKAQLTKSQEVCPECHGIGELLAVDFGYPSSDTNWKCPTCQGTGKAKKLDREKIFETIYYHKFPNAIRYKVKPLLHDKDSEELTKKLLALFDEEAIREKCKAAFETGLDMGRKAEREKVVKVGDSRIDGLERLLASYRVGKNPTEKLFSLLEKSKKDWQALKETK